MKIFPSVALARALFTDTSDIVAAHFSASTTKFKVLLGLGLVFHVLVRERELRERSGHININIDMFLLALDA